MSPETTNPAPVGRHGARKCDLAGRLITSEDTLSHFDLQRLRLTRRFGLNLATAALVADLAFRVEARR